MILRHTDLQALDLSRSADLVCHNIVCEKVGSPCICRLSHVLESLSSLKWLSLARNDLPSLPDSLCRLKELEFLDVSGNSLSVLPDSIAGLHSVRHIDIRDNKVGHLPKGVLELQHLEAFSADGNPALREDAVFLQLQEQLKA